MSDARSQMTDEERAACDAAYEAWVVKARESEEGTVPDAWTAGYQAGMATILEGPKTDA